MNRTIKLLIFSSIFVDTGFGFIGPMLSIFIKENLIGGTIFTAGMASAVYLIVKSVLQLPFAHYVDKHDDKVKWLLVGTAAMAVVPFMYIFCANVWYIYLAQIFLGLGSALAYPTWAGLWSTHLDKRKESYEWSLYSTLTGLGTAIIASLGAAIAQWYSFEAAFALVGLLAVIGFVILLGLQKSDVKLLNKM
ncbi:MAG: MFS transporter [Candidatus Magasanikbacteria bacterium]